MDVHDRPALKHLTWQIRPPPMPRAAARMSRHSSSAIFGRLASFRTSAYRPLASAPPTPPTSRTSWGHSMLVNCRSLDPGNELRDEESGEVEVGRAPNLHARFTLTRCQRPARTRMASAFLAMANSS